MKKQSFYRAVIFVFFLTAMSSFANQNLEVSIRYFNQEVYTLDSPIQLRVAIQNTSSSPQHFRLADYRQFTIDVTVRSSRNELVPPSQEYIRVKTMNRPVFFRDIRLEPGEEYAFVESLDKFVALQEPGMYVVSVVFSPDLLRQESPNNESQPIASEEHNIQSNQLSLAIRPSDSMVETAVATARREVQELLMRQDMPPDQTVRYSIQARQHQQWDEFFLYLDVAAIMLRDPRYERQYNNADENERQSMITRYQQNMLEQKTEDEILLIPDSFSIIQTSYTPSEGSVLVQARFNYGYYTEVKEYTYYLRRLDDYWQIYNYSVRNLGTE